MQAEYTQNNNIGIVTLSGGLNAVNVDGLRRSFKDWFDSNTHLKHIVMDFQAVDMIDSAGLGLLIALLKHIGSRGADLKLAGLPKRVRLVFEITRTQRIFEICDTVEAAIGS